MLMTFEDPRCVLENAIFDPTLQTISSTTEEAQKHWAVYDNNWKQNQATTVQKDDFLE